jgi:hypothetical protein
MIEKRILLTDVDYHKYDNLFLACGIKIIVIIQFLLNK